MHLNLNIVIVFKEILKAKNKINAKYTVIISIQNVFKRQCSAADTHTITWWGWRGGKEREIERDWFCRFTLHTAATTRAVPAWRHEQEPSWGLLFGWQRAGDSRTWAVVLLFNVHEHRAGSEVKESGLNPALHYEMPALLSGTLTTVPHVATPSILLFFFYQSTEV